MHPRTRLSILNHIRMFRVTTAEALSSLLGLPAAAHAEEMLEELRQERLAGSAELTPAKKYFYLLPKAAEVLHLPTVKSGPLVGTSKAEAYAVLHFCILQGVFRPLLETSAFQSKFAELYRPGPRIAYYTEGQRLGYLRVESKALVGDPYRVLEYCRRDVDKRTQWKGWRSAEFSRLVETGRFCVTVLVATEGRADRLRQELERARERHLLYSERARDLQEKPSGYRSSEPAFIAYQRWHRNDKGRVRKPPRIPPPMRVAVVPGLMDLIYPKPSCPPSSPKKALTRKQKRRRARKHQERSANPSPEDGRA